jgi:REP element-mobilizing transposase RayT
VVTVRRRKTLPHWEDAVAVYFVTFRLADSLPSAVLRKFEFEREDIVATAKAMRREPTLRERSRLIKLCVDKIEAHLDGGSGSCLLANPVVANMCVQTLRHFDGVRYRIYAWCVMPNHVHVIFQPLPEHRLSAILHAWKSYSAKGANRILRRSGDFWQREYYDHLIRNQQDLQRCIRYVLDNPKKGGLKDWLWVESKFEG